MPAHPPHPPGAKLEEGLPGEGEQPRGKQSHTGPTPVGSTLCVCQMGSSCIQLGGRSEAEDLPHIAIPPSPRQMVNCLFSPKDILSAETSKMKTSAPNSGFSSHSKLYNLLEPLLWPTEN